MLQAGQTAMVTGAGSGIGRAIAAALAERGVDVYLLGRRADTLRAAAAAIGPRAHALQTDLTDDAAVAAAARGIGGTLDVLVHCAGAYLRRPVAELGAAAWRDLDAVNLHAPILLTSVCLNQLRAARGQVVFINSTAALSPTGAGMAAYAASKAALRAATDALRQEVNGDGIRVLSIFPGRTETPMQAAILAEEGRVVAPGRLMQPQDVAAMVVAALSLPASAEVTEIVMRPMHKL